MKKIFIDYSKVESIRKAERLKEKLENKGYTLHETIQTGFNKFEVTFI